MSLTSAALRAGGLGVFALRLGLLVLRLLYALRWNWVPFSAWVASVSDVGKLVPRNLPRHWWPVHRGRSLRHLRRVHAFFATSPKRFFPKIFNWDLPLNLDPTYRPRIEISRGVKEKFSGQESAFSGGGQRKIPGPRIDIFRGKVKEKSPTPKNSTFDYPGVRNSCPLWIFLN